MIKKSFANAEEYIVQIVDKWKPAFCELRQIILKNLPAGFEETISYNMIGYVVPHSVYPAGYHVNPKLALPFINIASQKNYIAFYHLGIYSDKDLMSWFLNEYHAIYGNKPDMGKSCIRLKNPEKIPFNLLGDLVSKFSPQDWIKKYESQIRKI